MWGDPTSVGIIPSAHVSFRARLLHVYVFPPILLRYISILRVVEWRSVHGRFLDCIDPGVARVSDEGGEVSQLLRKAGFYASDAQVHAAPRGPASWALVALLSCVRLEAYMRLLLRGEIREFFWGPPKNSQDHG